MKVTHMIGMKSDPRRAVGGVGGWGYTVHTGCAFGICVEKNAALEPSLRKFKGRVVFQGNQVYDQDHNYAIFQDLGSSLATLQAAKVVDFFGALLGQRIEIADAEQAYIQVDMKGDPTWICLPPEARPSWWRTKFPNLGQPVCLLNNALYGHPEACTYWERKCGAHVRAVGFIPIGPAWPLCYYSTKLPRMLSVYADDFKLVGPTVNVPVGWEMLRKGLHIEPGQRVDAKGSVYLGCKHICINYKSCLRASLRPL